MSRSRIERVKEIYALALEVDPEERAGRIAELCEGDDSLRTEVESLLAASERMGGFLETPAPERLARLAPRPLEPGVTVGNYTIERILGSGGSGTVYEALQRSPRRRVALKVMHADLASDEARRRFRDEAEILARLQFPDIAHVYEAGVHETTEFNLPWFALEMVESGRNVVQYAEEEGLDVRARLTLVARICDAVHHGHQKGIIHRDIKPANLLVDAGGQLKVIDFGIARIAGLHAPAERPGAVPREIAGTLPYMSPEQYRLLEATVDVRSDVYALGVLLYEILTGRLPHEVARTPITEASRRIQEEAPTPLAVHDPSLAGDVELIVHRALAKERSDRYQSAADLGRDLRSYLEIRPIAARPPGWLYHARLFARRRTGVVCALAALLVVLVGAAVVSTTFAIRAERDRRDAVASRNLEQLQSYVAGIAAADAAVRVFDVSEARRRLEQAAPRFRNWEWSYLSGRIDGSVRTLRSANPLPFFYFAMSADGSRLVAGSGEPDRESSRLTIWDADADEPIAEFGPVPTRIRSPVLTPDGAWLAWGESSGDLVLADPADPENARRWEGHGEAVTRIAFSADGSTLASASEGGSLRLWSVPEGTLIREVASKEGVFAGVAFDPSGNRLATCSTDRPGISLWSLRDGDRSTRLEGHREPVVCLHFSPDGRRLVSGSRDATLRIWDTTSLEELHVLTRREEPVESVRFSPDGAHILSGHPDGTLTVWNADTGAEVETLTGHTARISEIAWGPEPGEMYSASRDGTVKQWRLGQRRVEAILGEHEKLYRGLAYGHDGALLACASFDGEIKLLSTRDGEEVGVLSGHEGGVQSVAFFHDGKRLVSGSSDGTTRVWDLQERTCRRVLRGHLGGVIGVAVSPDDALLASSSNDRSALLWDAGSGERRHVLPHTSWVWSVAFSPDSRLIATASADGHLHLWSTSSGEQIRRIQSGSRSLTRAIFSRDGSRVLACAQDGEVGIWSVPEGTLITNLPQATTSAHDAAFSPDETRLAVAAGRSVALWDLETGRLVLSLRGHKAQVYGVAFHPDGTQIASCSGGWEGEDCTVRLWGRIPGETWPPGR